MFPAQQTSEALVGNEPVEPRARSNDTPSSEAKKDEIEWVPVPIQNKGDRVIRVRGPVKIEAQSGAIGLDGIDYRVTWHPLDKDGKIRPTLRKPEGDTRRFGEYTGLNIPGETIHQPPYDNSHGFEVRISVPPQPTRHGNTRGPALNIFIPKGEKVN